MNVLQNVIFAMAIQIPTSVHAREIFYLPANDRVFPLALSDFLPP